MCTPSLPTGMKVPQTYYAAAKFTGTLFYSQFASGGLVQIATSTHVIVRSKRGIEGSTGSADMQ